MSDFLSRVEAILSGVMNFNPKSRVERLLMKLVGSVGNVEDLETEDKSSLVAAINEVAESDGGIDAYTKAETDALLDGKASAADVSAIEAKIPSAATSANQLADKAFVNSTVGTNTAYYISNNGQPFTSLAQLEAYSGTVTNNDYAFVVGTDSASNTTYTRYKYNASTEAWAAEYVLNNSSFTAAQWAAIQSGITAEDVALIGTAVQPSDLDDYAKTEDVPTQLAQLTSDSTHRVVTDAEKSTWNGKSDVVISSVSNITPTQVATAISQGKTVVITVQDGTYGSLSFEAWNVATDWNLVLSNTTSWVFGVWATISLQGNLSNNTWQLDSAYIATSQDVDSKLDISQGVAHAGEFLVVGADGNVTTKTLQTWQGGSY